MRNLTAPASEVELEARRRFAPRPWHHDWHHLRELRRAITRAASSFVGELPQAATVLDYGSGGAPYRSLIAIREGIRYVTCDIAGTPELLIETDAPVPLPTASVNAVVSFQVLEHVARPEAYLAECRRLLRPDGKLLLTTHGTWLYHPHPTDYRRWTRDGLRLELERHGFAIDRVSGVVGPLAWTTQFRLFGYRSVLMRLPLGGQPLTGLACLLMNGRMLLEERVTPDSIRQRDACVYLVLAQPA